MLLTLNWIGQILLYYLSFMLFSRFAMVFGLIRLIIGYNNILIKWHYSKKQQYSQVDYFLDSGVTLFLLWASGAFHVIDSGHIGVYKRGGALLNSWS